MMVLQDVTAIRATTEQLMVTMDEINTIAFVLLKVLTVTAPRKKQGLYASHDISA